MMRRLHKFVKRLYLGAQNHGDILFVRAKFNYFKKYIFLNAE